MSETIKVAALALINDRRQVYGLDPIVEWGCPSLSDVYRRNALQQARVVLSTIREPTDEMLVAAGQWALSPEHCRKAWRAAIDEALRKSPDEPRE